MKPLRLADHDALELLDTTFVLQGQPVELIGDGADYLGWLVDAGLLEERTAKSLRRRFSAAELDGAAAEARKLRDWAADWIGRWSVAPHGAYDAELRRLNALLLHQATRKHVVRNDDGALAIVEELRGDRLDELVGLLAARLAHLVTAETPELVKRCAGAACTLWFVDRTKAHRRRFCSAAACGNRDKVAAYRERERQRARQRG